MRLYPHPQEFEPIYRQFLATWKQLDGLCTSVRECVGSATNPILFRGFEEELSRTFEVSYQSALYTLHCTVLQACHDHCVAPPEWVDRSLDCAEPEYPELPFACSCGLPHDWDYHPTLTAKEIALLAERCSTTPGAGSCDRP